MDEVQVSFSLNNEYKRLLFARNHIFVILNCSNERRKM